MREVVPLPGVEMGVEVAFAGFSANLIRTVIVFVLKSTDAAMPCTYGAASYRIACFKGLKLVIEVGLRSSPYEQAAIVVLSTGFALEEPMVPAVCWDHHGIAPKFWGPPEGVSISTDDRFLLLHMDIINYTCSSTHQRRLDPNLTDTLRSTLLNNKMASYFNKHSSTFGMSQKMTLNTTM